ncbi:branched-chain amino acid aminotransferase [Temperatibacter marinus]|uniref:Branched-chain-amino-acid aminotransferase n=1 Tax=Temperatibacter marinus TaxID=1456591 RepID=A0AA52H9F1_9PROT|nr:branched-chain amino acid aminotransferase [Temperatibacter marinus]WND02844.1 branched-chain amino acid aminotransferase [Temperatibacter marinus]
MSASFDDRDGWIWMDGEMVQWREANVHILTHALHYATSVFEGQRAYSGQIFELEAHTNRLFKSADIIGMDIPYSREVINQACKDNLIKNGLVDAYQRPVVWRGSEQMGINTKLTKVHVAIASWEWPSYFAPEAKLKGLRLCMSNYRRPNPETAPILAKSAANYPISCLSKEAAELKGYDDALLLDWEGYVGEATGANIFFIKGSEIHTPSLKCVLDGITRRTVMGLAQKRGLTVVERNIKPEEMADFEQAFLTGTAAEVTPLSHVAGYDFVVGQEVQNLMNDYEALVRDV